MYSGGTVRVFLFCLHSHLQWPDREVCLLHKQLSLSALHRQLLWMPSDQRPDLQQLLWVEKAIIFHRNIFCLDDKNKHGLFYPTEDTCTSPIDGEWGAWTSWSACSLGCSGYSTRERRRECDDPEPANGGMDCSGVPYQNEYCQVPREQAMKEVHNQNQQGMWTSSALI